MSEAPGHDATVPAAAVASGGGPATGGRTERSQGDAPVPLVPQLSLPKGGGAIRGIGEKSAVNPATGAATCTIPIATSPGRSRFGPQLALGYDSGAGNGPFGFGWALPIPAITRKTDKGLPRYRDGDEDTEESDTFILSGAEDLVPVLVETDAGWKPAVVPRTVGGVKYRLHLYRPRVEGLFARIERWVHAGTGETSFWRSISRDNVTTLYGKGRASRTGDAPAGTRAGEDEDEEADPRIADPADPSRVFSWLICETYDDKGNAVRYSYKQEDSAGVDRGLAHERNRTDADRAANRYLKRIRYGNRVSRLVDPSLASADWIFEAVFDYGEHDLAAPTPHGPGTWIARNDPFSSRRAGFEVRTYRLCQRILMFHHFPEETSVGRDYLVRSTDLRYRSNRGRPEDQRHGNPLGSFLAAVTQSGYRRRASGGYTRRALPPVELEYTTADIHDEIREIDAASGANLPIGLDGTTYQWVDLDGEGISGVLTDQGGGWYYKPNLGAGRFGPVETVASKPATGTLTSGRQQLLDLAGSGHLDLVALAGPVPGFFERTDDRRWDGLTPFESLPVIDWDEPNLRFVDLTGDGHADVLVTEGDGLRWYPSLARAGFGPATRTSQPADEERGPRLVFADASQSIHLADMTGDGLSDLVRVRNGEVCYWPNLGYGRFGPKATMDGAPWFDAPDMFDQRRVLLADIDGTGTTDLVYLHRDGARIYFNQLGNGWGEPHPLPAFPPVDSAAAVTAIDLLGTGTACLVWSSPLPGDARRPLRYVDLLGGRKPHLLVSVRNNLGAETRIDYAQSTRFYLADKAAGRPWATRLPFPVQVVTQMTVADRISGSRLVTSYTYHHGHFDGAEREFRGFGLVDQVDTEELGTHSPPAGTAGQQAGDGPSAADEELAFRLPPVRTRTWFHTGACLDSDTLTARYAEDYYHEGQPTAGVAGPGRDRLRAMLLDDTVLPTTLRRPDRTRTDWALTPDELREARRALRGSVLRRELYALDGTPDSDRPYLVAESNQTVELLQPQATNQHAVFFAHPREAVEFHYERKLHGPPGRPGAPDTRHADPRVTHAAILDVDLWGNVERSVAIGYGRRVPDPDPLLTPADREKQRRTLVTATVTGYTNPVPASPVPASPEPSPDAHRGPLPCESRSYELINLAPAAPASVGGAPVTPLFRFDELRAKLDQAAAHELPDEDVEHAGATTPGLYRRIIEHLRTRYRSDDLTGLLPAGQLQSLALPGETYKLAFTAGLLSRVYQRDGQPLLPADPSGLLTTEGGYVASAATVADAGATDWWVPSGRVFYHPDPTATPAAELEQARRHFFLPRRFRDPFGHDAVAAYDEPHDLLPVETVDPVGNTVRAEHDYRVLAPQAVTDPNGNRTEVAFDALGLVAATAVAGKPGEPVGDSLAALTGDPAGADPEPAIVKAFAADPPGLAAALLGTASTRIVYDLDRFARCGQPPFAVALARETHLADAAAQPAGDAGPPRIRISVVYSDGFGRALQTKVQAEPGAAPERGPAVAIVAGDPPAPTGDVRPGDLVLTDGHPAATPTARRWVGTGRTVYNHKGKPVRRYEPFFSSTHLYEPERELTDTGVSSILAYDPIERVVATLHPDHSYDKVVFDPWRQATWDGNDTVALDPRTDPDIAGLLAGYFATQPVGWQPWREAHPDGAAACAPHAGTPGVTFFDPLRRAFLTVADNGASGAYPTRVELDVAGNQRMVTDARGIAVLTSEFDLLGRAVTSSSPDAGGRWTLPDAAGRPIRRWDSGGFTHRLTYDQRRRPLERFTTDAGGTERLAERTVYGEAQGPSANHRNRVYQVFDGAGVVTNDAFDFKGNVARTTRRLLRDPAAEVNWPSGLGAAAETLLEPERFTAATRYDALNRAVQVVAPHSDTPGATINLLRPGYNDAGLLERVDAWLEQAAEPAGMLVPDSATHHVVTGVDYNARGQRTRIDHGNGTVTTYDYDPLTFRLRRIQTRRGRDALQDLTYSFDPVGNVLTVVDAANDRVFHSQEVVLPGGEFRYDPLYRLVTATGREHRGDDTQPDHDDAVRRVGVIPNDGRALRNYTEIYRYDEVGNVLQVRHHRGRNPDQPGEVVWNRRYQYAPDSNRLLATSLPGDPTDLPPHTATPGYTARYTYDAHGNLTSAPYPLSLDWDDRDRLHSVDLGGGGRAHYQYDATGTRLRKLWVKQPGLVEERIYLGGFEIFRRRTGPDRSLALERETLHIMDGAQRVAMVETRTHGTDPAPRQLVRYQYANHLRSAVLELDEAAQVISYEEYHPYGTTAYQATRNLTDTPRRYRHTAKERDEETGFAYHGARYYAPWLARWTAPDPAGLSAGPNPYEYVRSRPLTLVDNLGLAGDDPYPPDPGRQLATDLKVWASGPSQLTKKVLDPAVRAWNTFRTKLTNAVFDRRAYDEAKASGLPTVTPNAGLMMTDEIVKRTPEASGNVLLVVVAGAEGTVGPKGPVAAGGRPLVTEAAPAPAVAEKPPVVTPEPPPAPPVTPEKPAAAPEGPPVAPSVLPEKPAPPPPTAPETPTIWGKGNVIQGRGAEAALETVTPGTHFYGSFPRFDRAAYSSGGPSAPALEVGQLKSIDTSKKSYQGKGLTTAIESAAGDIAGVGESTWEGGGHTFTIGPETRRVLDVAIPDTPLTAAQEAAIAEAVAGSATMGVEVRIYRVH